MRFPPTNNSLSVCLSDKGVSGERGSDAKCVDRYLELESNPTPETVVVSGEGGRPGGRRWSGNGRGEKDRGGWGRVRWP